MPRLADETREQIIDMYRDALSEAIEGGYERDEVIETAMIHISDSTLGDVFDDAWDDDEELREAIAELNTTVPRSYASDDDYDDEDDY